MVDVKQVIVVRKDLNMRKGKIAAQCAHAAMLFLLNGDESDHADTLHIPLSTDEAVWVRGFFTKIVVSVDSEQKLRDLILRAKLLGIEAHAVVDNGKTEFNGVPTLTCAAFGPTENSRIDELTGHLTPL